MLLIDNLHIHCLEWEYTVDSSSLPADLQWISFTLQSALWKILYVVCKMCKTLDNNYEFSPVQCVINQATNDTKIKPLLWSFRLFFVQYFSVKFPG